VPAVGKVMLIEVPGENATPELVANWLGAPASAENVPFCPVTSMWVPPVADGSLNVTACPALIEAEDEVKLRDPMVMVAAPAVPAVGVGGAVVAVGGGGAGVSVGGVEAVDVEPHAARTRAKPIRSASAIRFITAILLSIVGIADTITVPQRRTRS
jgi:hypothetical protein